MWLNWAEPQTIDRVGLFDRPIFDEQIDSRSYTADWSVAGRLNTKRIYGTMVRFM